MKYALLVYDVPADWKNLAIEDRRALHGEYEASAAAPGIIGHYRVHGTQPTTVRSADAEVVKSEGPLLAGKETFRALFLLESDDTDAVLDFAAQLPAARLGGAVEVWPLAGH